MILDGGCSTPVPMMKGETHEARVCLAHDSHLRCYKCKYEASRNNNKTNNNATVEWTDGEEDIKNMTRARTHPTMMKLTLMLCNYLADIACYELGAKLTKKGL